MSRDSLNISVCIPAYNEESNIRQCLNSVISQSGVHIREILVGINSSTDATQQIVEEFFKHDTRVKVINSAKGKTNAWNALNKNATCNIRVFQDGDCVAPLGSYARLMGLLNKHDIVGASLERDTRGCGLITKLLNFPRHYIDSQGRLNGGLYVMDYTKVSNCMRRLINDTAMPHDIINDDAFLQFVCNSVVVSKDIFVTIRSSGGISDEIRRYKRIDRGSFLLIKKYGNDGIGNRKGCMPAAKSLMTQFTKASLLEKIYFPFILPIKFVIFRYIHYMAKKIPSDYRLEWK